MVHRRTSFLAVAVAVLVGASACSSETPGFADLEGDGPSAKSLPAAVVENLGDGDPESYRWVGEHEGSDVWIAPGVDDDYVCLLAYDSDEEWMTSCGVSGDGTPHSMSGYGSFYAVRDGQAVPDGATALSANVYAD